MQSLASVRGGEVCHGARPIGHLARPDYVPRRSRRLLKTASMGLAEVSAAVQGIADQLSAAAPAPIQPAVSIICGDIASVAAGAPTLAGIGRLAVSGAFDRPHLV